MITGWPVALTIAGSDSWGGAGIQADMRAFAAFGVWGTTAVTAVTAQNHMGVSRAMVLPGDLVRAQIDAVAEATGWGAVKTGMLGDAQVIAAVADALREHRLGPLVVDPVQAASQGGRLLDPAAVPLLTERVLPECRLLTPNIPEAEALLGASIAGPGDLAEAAAALAALGPRAVLVKGGHLSGAGCPDLLWDEGRVTWLDGPRLAVAHSHGTGCTLSAAVTAQMAAGTPLEEACRRAKDYVTSSLRFLQRPGSAGV